MVAENVAPTVREARRGDIEVIVEFNSALARETEELTLDAGVVKAGVRAVLDNPGRGVYYVAGLDDHVAGVLLLTFEWSDWRNGEYLWIQSVYVRPQYRRQGIFRALYEHVRQLSKSDGRCGLRLYAEAHNEAAIATYEKLGMCHYGYHVYETTDTLRNGD